MEVETDTPQSFPYPHERNVVNLAPASVRKEGPGYDLPIAPHPPVEVDSVLTLVLTDFREIKGQELVKRTTEVAAAGGHAMLMVGPP